MCSGSRRETASSLLVRALLLSGQGSTRMTSCNPNHLPEASPLNAIPLGVIGLQHVNLGDTNIQSVTSGGHYQLAQEGPKHEGSTSGGSFYPHGSSEVGTEIDQETGTPHYQGNKGFHTGMWVGLGHGILEGWNQRMGEAVTSLQDTGHSPTGAGAEAGEMLTQYHSERTCRGRHSSPAHSPPL